ncbi:aminotransferase class V-fold PLP-dependent enzyme [Anaerosalibacter bizertensis]|uniref:cysteine desulfurase n=1 Tax=Anaerosalibacter bizertensis TaxID=932217 RepID=A0A844FJJ5_9FIRM|nr:aminotransferase class V-fold PLP-dependent enzyme [Anaerosalibacter bizertensis]MSS44234.1 aminotransferase class V-fold PLP-dependent enzyme [Anaerosalibacter bizertensis]
MIYFDNAATSFPKPEVVYESTLEAMKEYGANPGRAGHKLALRAGRGIYEARDVLSRLFNIKNPMNLIFTYNCTDSLNLGIKGLLKKGDHVITTSMEHNSVLRPLKHLEKYGIETTIINGDSKGRINPLDIEKSIKENTKMIIMTHISNLTGTIMPIKEVGEIAKKKDIIYMVDGAQSAGVYDIDVEDMNIDLLAFPGHKGLLGPQGTGGLYIRDGIFLKELKEGGTGSSSDSLYQPDIMPDKYESGTPNAPGIIGLGNGVNYILEKGMNNIREHEENLTEYFIEELLKIDGVKIYGPLDIKEQAPVVSINIRDEDSSEISYILDEEYNIAVRSGLHCAPLAHKTIGTFKQGVIRFSFGVFNTYEEIELGIEAIKEISKEV